MKKIKFGFTAFALMSFLVASSAQDEDVVFEPRDTNVTKKEKLEIKYDFVKDTTKITGRSVNWRTGEVKISEDGLDFSNYVDVRFYYSHEGKSRVKPRTVSVVFYENSSSKLSDVDDVFFRFGSKKMTVSGKTTLWNSEYGSAMKVEGDMPLEAFLQLSKSNEVYIKFDNDNRVFVIKNPFMFVAKEVAQTVPQPKPKPKK